MGFILSKLIEMAMQPGTVIVALCMLGTGILIWRRQSPWGWRFLFIGVGALAAVSILPIGTWLLRPLEDRFPPPERLPPHVDGIIELGGAIELDLSEDRGMPLFNWHAGRLTGFVALAHRYPEARLLFTGGNGAPFPDKATEADVARTFFASQGIDPRRFLFESASRNTRENAVYSRQLVDPKPGQVWLLVTSAGDMPRAVGCFRAVGWKVVPVPFDYHTPAHASGLFPGPAEGMKQTKWALHEWLGMIYYRMRGWTTSLFPGPENPK